MTGMNGFLCREIEVAYRGLTVLVTGSTGFIGQRLVKELLSYGSIVLAGVSGRSKSSASETWVGQNNLHIFEYDLASELRFDQLKEFGGIDLVFHLAAAGVHPKFANCPSAITENTLGAYHLAKFLSINKVNRLVCVGSCFEYGGGDNLSETAELNPVSVYALSKILARDTLAWGNRSKKIDVAYLRPFTVFGPGERPDRLIPYVIDRVVHGEPAYISDGEQIRDFIFVDDVVAAFLQAGVHPNTAGETLNICTGRGYSVRSIVELICATLGSNNADIRYGEVARRQTDTDILVGDPSKAERLMGWKSSVEIDQGIQSAISTL